MPTLSKAEAAFHKVGSSIDGAEASQMFGKKCYKAGGKAFVCFFQEAMVFKLSGEEHASALALSGSVLFDPSGKGRAMKAWVQVHHDQRKSWAKLAAAAHAFVTS